MYAKIFTNIMLRYMILPGASNMCIKSSLWQERPFLQSGLRNSPVVGMCVPGLSVGNFRLQLAIFVFSCLFLGFVDLSLLEDNRTGL